MQIHNRQSLMCQSILDHPRAEHTPCSQNLMKHPQTWCKHFRINPKAKRDRYILHKISLKRELQPVSYQRCNSKYYQNPHYKYMPNMCLRCSHLSQEHPLQTLTTLIQNQVPHSISDTPLNSICRFKNHFQENMDET